MDIQKDFLNFLDKCVKKDKVAWDRFIEKYSNLVYKYIIKTLNRYTYTFQNGEVSEIFNSIFLALLDEDCRRLRNFRGQNEYSFLAYLREISFHITIDFLRIQRRFIDVEKIQNFISTEDSSTQLDHRDLTQIILKLKDELPERHKYLFKLIYEEDLNPSKIAGLMNINLNALNQLKFRMLKNIIKIAKKKNLYQELSVFIKGPSIFDLHEFKSLILTID